MNRHVLRMVALWVALHFVQTGLCQAPQTVDLPAAPGASTPERLGRADELPLGDAGFYPSPQRPLGYRGDGNSYFPNARIPAMWWEGTVTTRQDPQGRRGKNETDFLDAVPYNIVWKTEMPGWATTQPLVVGDRVFTLCNPDMLTCVDARTGKILWTRVCNAWELAGVDPPTAERCHALFMALIAVEGFMGTPAGPPPLTGAQFRPLGDCFLKTGYPRIMGALRKYDPEGDYAAVAKVALDRTRQRLATPADENVLGFDEEDRQFAEEIGDRINAISGLARHVPPWNIERDFRGALYNYHGYCLPSPLSDGTYVYAYMRMGQVVCYDLEGNRKWGRCYDGRSELSPSLADGVFMFCPRRDEVVGLDAATGRELWRTPVATRGNGNRNDEAPIAGDKVLRLSNGTDTLDVLVTSRNEILRVSDGKVVGFLPAPSGTKRWVGCTIVGTGGDVFRGGSAGMAAEAYRLVLEDCDTVTALLQWQTDAGDRAGYTPRAVVGNALVQHCRSGNALDLFSGDILAPPGPEVGGQSLLVAGANAIWIPSCSLREVWRRREDGKAVQQMLASDVSLPWAPRLVSAANWMFTASLPRVPSYDMYFPELADNRDFVGEFWGRPGHFIWAENPMLPHGNRLFLRSISHLYCIGDPTEPYCGKPEPHGDRVLDAPTKDDLPALQARLDSPERTVRIGAVQAVRRLGPDAAPLAPTLVEMVKTGPDARIETGILGLRALGTAAAPVAGDLAALTTSDDPAVRMHAYLAMARMGPRVAEIAARLVGNARTVPAAVGMLANLEGADDEKARLLAGLYVSHNGTPAPRQITGLEEEVPAWQAAHAILRRMGGSARAALPALTEYFGRCAGRDTALEVAELCVLIDPGGASDVLPAVTRAFQSLDDTLSDEEFAASMLVLHAAGASAVAQLPSLQALAESDKTSSRRRKMLRSVANHIGAASGQPRILLFTADVPAINLGETTHLVWRVDGAAGVKLEPQNTDCDPVGTMALSPTVTTAYRLVATGTGGQACRELTVQVRPAQSGVAAAMPERLQGLAAEIYSCRTDGRLPDFATLQPEGGSVVPNFPEPSIDGLGTAGGVAVRMSGALVVPRDGAYTFYSDWAVGPTTLFLDGKEVLHDSGKRSRGYYRGRESGSATLELTAGIHPIQVLYVHQQGAYGLALRWQGPGFRKSNVPPEAFADRLEMECFKINGDEEYPELEGLTPYTCSTIPVPFLAPLRQSSAMLFERKGGFAVRYRGYLDIPVDGRYTFYAKSANGSALCIGDERVVDNDRDNPALAEVAGSIWLKAGVHPIRVLYAWNRGQRGLAVSWEGPTLAKEAVPALLLTHERAQEVGPLLPSALPSPALSETEAARWRADYCQVHEQEQAAPSAWVRDWRVTDNLHEAIQWVDDPNKPPVRIPWLADLAGQRRGLLVIHAPSPDRPCRVRRDVAVPAEGVTRLCLGVARRGVRRSWFRLVANGEELWSHRMDANGWQYHEVDLTRFAGQRVSLSLELETHGEWVAREAVLDYLSVITTAM